MTKQKKIMLNHLLKQYKQSLNQVDSSEGYSFNDMKTWARSNKNNRNEKITFGTRKNLFYIISKGDRDYNNTFSVTPLEFLDFDNHKQAQTALTGAIHHGRVLSGY